MIDLVLEDSREKVFRLPAQGMPLPIETVKGHSTMPRNEAAQVRYREATLKSFDRLVTDWCKDRVEQHDHVTCMPLRTLSDPPSDDDTSALVDLRRCQADAICGRHRLDHVVDELLELGVVRPLDRCRWANQDRVAEARDRA